MEKLWITGLRLWAAGGQRQTGAVNTYLVHSLWMTVSHNSTAV
ncbi:hypothetical protein [Streptomyces sp. NPDC046887]